MDKPKGQVVAQAAVATRSQQVRYDASWDKRRHNRDIRSERLEKVGVLPVEPTATALRGWRRLLSCLAVNFVAFPNGKSRA